MDRTKQSDLLSIKYIDALLFVIGTIWLLLTLGVPRAYTNLKTGLLAILCFITLVDYTLENRPIEMEYIWKTFLFILYFMFSLFVGVISGFPFSINNDFALIRYFVITPIAALLLGMIFYSENRYAYLKNGLIIFAALISFFDVLALLYLMGAFPHIFVFDYMYVANIKYTDTKLMMRMSSDPALIFLIPYCIFILPQIKNKSLILRGCTYVAIVFGIIYTALSGRKILAIVIALAVFFMLLYIIYFESLRTYARIFLIITITFLIMYLSADKLSEIFHVQNIFQSAFSTIKKGLESDSFGVSHRNENINALFHTWLESPMTMLTGNGLNSYAENSLASDTTKWSYEVFYNAFLSQTGVIGLLILLYTIFSFMKIMLYCFKITRDIHHLAILIASICFCFASGTNPLIYNVWFWAIMWAEKYYYNNVLLKENA